MKFIIVISCLIISGCASLSPEECKQADWYLIGMTDAQKGFSKLRIDDHRKACAKVQVTPDLFTYQRGHEKGQKTYCTTQNGFTQGAAGTNYQGACEGYLADDFLRVIEMARSYTKRAPIGIKSIGMLIIITMNWRACSAK
jgi:Protein of unknown function (DUF2799)